MTDLLWRRDREATVYLLGDWRAITQDDLVIAEVWQHAAADVVKRDPDFAEKDAAAVQALATETKAAARAWLSEVARAWLAGDGAEWVTGGKSWPVSAVPLAGEDGVPAVSMALAEFMEQIDPATAKLWIETEQDRATLRLSQLHLWAEDQPWALPGWYAATAPPINPDDYLQHLSRVIQVSIYGTRAMTARYEATHAARTLALAAWNHRVRDQLTEQRKQIARKLNRAVALPLAYSFSELSGPATVDTAGTAAIVRSRKRDTGLLVPAVDLEVAKVLIANADLHTVHAHRTMDFLLSVSWEAYVQGGEAARDGWRARIQYDGSIYVEISGGRIGLAQIVGVAGNNAQGIPFRTIEALSRLHLRVESEDQELCGSLVSDVSWTRGNQIRPGRVCFTLSAWFGVGVVHRLRERDRLLVPAIGVPPMDGIAERIQPAVASMERAAIVELAIGSRELVKYGSVKVDWYRLGADRGLSREAVEKVLNKWCEQGRWQRHGYGWRLGDNADVAKAHELLMIGGSMREASSRRGRVSADQARKKALLKANN